MCVCVCVCVCVFQMFSDSAATIYCTPFTYDKAVKQGSICLPV